MDLAVAVVVGAAFTGIVNSIVDGILNPLIGAVFQAKSLENSLIVTLPTLGSDHVELKFGAVIAALIKFILVSAVIYFAILSPIKKLSRLGNQLNTLTKGKLSSLTGLGSAEDKNAKETPKTPSADEEEVALLREIRDLLKNSRN